VRYVDFSLKLEPRNGEEHPVLVLGSPAGEGRGTLKVPFANGSLDQILADLGQAVRGSALEAPVTERHSTNRHLKVAFPSPQSEPAPERPRDPQSLGGELFRSLFPGSVRDLFQHSLGSVEADPEGGLRLALHFDSEHPDLAVLASLPWELLYWQERREYLCLGKKCPLVRYLDVPRPARPLRIAERPLRILEVGASPDGLPPLDLPRERERIEESWAKLPEVEVEFLEHASPTALRAKLCEKPFHVLHFMGHGGFGAGTGVGTLVFEGDDHRPAPLPGPVLAELLRDFTSLQLAVLNACDTARSSREGGLDPFSGVAAALVMAGLPAVTAMQFPISDGAAIAFSTALYQRLAAGEPVDAAVVEGRMAIHLRDVGSLEWATPVLFLRSAARAAADPPKPPTPPDLERHRVDFSSFLAEKTAGFVGRRWVFDAVDRFTGEKPRGYFVLRGDPGVGKSAFLAEMVRRGGYPHHFNIRAAGIQRPETFLGNLSAQLVARYGLGYTALPPEATQDSRFLSSLLGKVSGKLAPGEKAVLVVDALDEADQTSLIPGVNNLYLPTILPAGVYVVASTRRGPLHLRIECEQQVLDLEQDSAGNLADVREFVESKLSLPGIRAYLDAQGLDEATFADEMVGKSQGNFMYLRYVLPEIEGGAYKDRKLDALPLGLANYYEDHWRRMRASDEEAWLAYQLPVLVALTVVKEPVSVDLMAEFSGIPEHRRIRSVLADWDAFLYSIEVDEAGRKQKRYRLYHASFYDFIAAKDEIAGEHVDLKAAHGRIADVLWKELEGEL
jgi:hypothetical protein